MADIASNERFSAAGTMLRLAWAADPGRSVLALVLFSLQALASTLFAWWLKVILDAVHGADMAALAVATGGLAASLAATTLLSQASNQTLLALRERADSLVEQRLIELVGHTPTLEIHETPEHLTHLEVLQRQAWQFGETVPALVQLLAIGVRIAATAALLFTVSPVLLLLGVPALPALLLSSRIGRLHNCADDQAAASYRRSGVLYDLATKSEAAKEVRLFRLGGELLSRFHAEYLQLVQVYRRASIRAEGIGLASRMIFLIGYFGAIIFVVDRAAAGRATVGDVALTAVLAGQVLGLIAGSAEMLGFAWQNLGIASRFVRLQAVSQHSRRRIRARAAVPHRLVDGIHLDHVGYRYPHAGRDALHDITLQLPAGSTVAVVGDNGAGKTTLVKLLTGLYLPGAGRISVDGTDLALFDPEAWRQHTSAGFQDHARFELLLREAVGIGDLAAFDDAAAVRTAVRRAGAGDFIDALPQGLNTQLGPSWSDGIDLSGGQWQKISISRAMMRAKPLLLLLDEPTAALDADTEHRLFEQWAAASERIERTSGAITVLVSHRFSTVRMAGLIVVLDHGRLIEVGNHDELMAGHGLYSELFELQARSYR
ncbi:MAG: ABC transporter ATP-binding protein [Microlunatus sp.]|nr:ABC transporter ATP-binding protein [Microlunatus sp.]